MERRPERCKHRNTQQVRTYGADGDACAAGFDEAVLLVLLVVQVSKESVVVVCAIRVVGVVGEGVDIGCAEGARGLYGAGGHAICFILWEKSCVDGQGNDDL